MCGVVFKLLLGGSRGVGCRADPGCVLDHIVSRAAAAATAGSDLGSGTLAAFTIFGACGLCSFACPTAFGLGGDVGLCWVIVIFNRPGVAGAVLQSPP